MATNPGTDAPRPDRPEAAFYGLAAAGSLALAIGPTLGFRCNACSGGLLSIALPWMGLLFYALLAVGSVRWPGAPWVLSAPGFYLFVHSSLLTEMLRMERFCVGCIGVAVAAAGAAAWRLRRRPAEWLAPGLALGLGGAAALFSPFDRTDDLLTRTFWPAGLLETAPAWVSREEMARCDHAAPVRLLLYERDCKT